MGVIGLQDKHHAFDFGGKNDRIRGRRNGRRIKNDFIVNFAKLADDPLHLRRPQKLRGVRRNDSANKHIEMLDRCRTDIGKKLLRFVHENLRQAVLAG